MSFFHRAASLREEGASFHGTSDLDFFVLMVACKDQSMLRVDGDGNPTGRKMRTDAERTFRAQFDLSAAQYSDLVELCDEGGGIGDVFEAYERALPSAQSDYVRSLVCFSGNRCPNESCENAAFRVTVLKATYYGSDECYPVKHYVKTCRGGCKSTFYLNKVKERGLDGVSWHRFYAWSNGVPPEITNKSGKSVLSAGFISQVALTLSRMRYDFRSPRVSRAGSGPLPNSPRARCYVGVSILNASISSSSRPRGVGANQANPKINRPRFGMDVPGWVSAAVSNATALPLRC